MPRFRATRAAFLALPVMLLAACSGGESESAVRPAASAASAGAPPSDPLVARADSARIRGSAGAPVWLLEVSDYQCPFCKTWHDEVFPTIIRDYVETGRVRLAYVNFPLGMHPNAPIAAESAMCAGAQGPEEFWRYHDLVFETQATWAPMSAARPHFDSLAGQSGLDTAAFASCLDERLMLPLVEADMARMKAAGVGPTPTFFIGDTKLEGAQPVEVFRQAIDAALAAQPAAGSPTPTP
ncbi:MAG: DsbA family protein [Gemmatimonadaceae bacterium]